MAAITRWSTGSAVCSAVLRSPLLLSEPLLALRSANQLHISVHPLNGTPQPENGQIPGTVAGYAFLGRTVRLEVQLRNGNLVTVAVRKHDALANSLEPGTQVGLTMGTCQIFPETAHV